MIIDFCTDVIWISIAAMFAGVAIGIGLALICSILDYFGII